MDANFVRVDTALEVMPGVRLVRNLSETKVFAETPEISLAIDTSEGQLSAAESTASRRFRRPLASGMATPASAP